MKNRKLIMKLPEGFAQALKRKHQGAPRNRKEIKDAYSRLQKLYKKYNKNKKKLEYLLDIEWEEKRIEDYFREPIWYNAHRKRERYEKNKLDARKEMFYILTNFDGNGREQFCKYNSIGADDIMWEFKDKYFWRLETNDT